MPLDLIDVEVGKIRGAADKICARHNAGEIISINRSVDQTLKNIIMLQMMLQFKLDRLHEIILLSSSAATGGTPGTLTTSDGCVTGVTTETEKPQLLLKCGPFFLSLLTLIIR